MATSTEQHVLKWRLNQTLDCFKAGFLRLHHISGPCALWSSSPLVSIPVCMLFSHTPRASVPQSLSALTPYCGWMYFDPTSFCQPWCNPLSGLLHHGFFRCVSKVANPERRSHAGNFQGGPDRSQKSLRAHGRGLRSHGSVRCSVRAVYVSVTCSGPTLVG